MKSSFFILSLALGLAVAQNSRAADAPKAAATNDEQRFEERFKELQKARNEEQMAAFERDARLLMKEFPKRPEPYMMLLTVSQRAEPSKRREIVEEISKSPNAPEEVKQQLEGMTRQMNAIGHPLDVKFTALDGREVDLAKLKGKVVLVDFWATWCGPCVGEVPNVKAAYNKLHSRGFEIVGISLDKDKDALENFVKSKDMPWPQYFDGKGWQNKYAQYCGVESIPAMWLVGRDGLVTDTDGRENLAQKVEDLLAAKETPASSVTQ